MKKWCSRCETAKPVTAFYKKGTSRQSMCIDCTKAYHREHYLANKPAYYASRDRHQTHVRQWVMQYKRSHPCVDCGGYFHPAAMHFHHLDAATKIDGVSALARHSLRRVKAEIEKCILLCANCHAVRTWPNAGVATETSAKR